ncbi:S-sulfocysteine synthase [Brucella sp. NBRC 12951]|uniref:Pyridoxal-5-phosphate-dependent protein subunit beta n=1 Tax=Brucella cytisi TaxID=407152 RepID=A0A1J6HR87_9HYPH|nr:MULTISPECIES: cysteine synthase family protein [Brucella/Ochrobactrum group]EXL05068.1 pyridoxal-5-phosphate-dependent protein subunit beta [Brucella anthropi]MBA8862696.1 cysteine synthase A [Brucella anthropi]OIS94905.1 pyridoxal-5-phosphate-dependent protein subunit beta [Brucella cytisi]
MKTKSFLHNYETPRIIELAPNFFAAQFRLMKLLPARYMLDRAEQNGLVRPGGHIVETSSGTFALALAMLSAIRGYRLTIVSATSLMDHSFKSRLEQLGCTTKLVEDPCRTGNQDGRLAELHRVLNEEPDAFWPRQYDNPDNPAAYSRLAETIVDELGRIDCLVGCVGSGGSLCGTTRYLREIYPEMCAVAVDTNNSVLFGQQAGPRLLRGLGNSILPKNLNHCLIDEVHWIGALRAFARTRNLFRDSAIFVGPTSGAAALVGSWHAQNAQNKTVVAIMADEGYRYQSTVYCDDWLSSLSSEWPTIEKHEPTRLREISAAGENDWTCLNWARRRLTP